jgi:NitT/TauT family transport system substrate-binding protein
MKRNLLLKFTLLILLINLLTSCAEVETAPISKSPLRVQFTQWWGDYTLLVAHEKGFFEKYGVQVEPIYYDVFSDTYPDLASGQIDGALIAVGDTINIDRSANMGTSDVTIVAMDPEDTLAALQRGQVQAADTWEPYLSDALSNGYKTIYPQEQLHLFPDLIVFRKSIVDERPEEVRAFLKAWFQAVEYRLQHEGETRDIAAKYLGVNAEDVFPDNNLRLYTRDDNRSLFDIQKANSIYSITKITSDYLISIGVMAEEIDPLEILDPAYLP